MNKIRVFLKDTLGLELSEAKTKITNANSEHAEFLSVRIKKSNHETYAVRRGVVSRNVKNMRLTAPIDKVTKKLTNNGFMAGDRPYPKFI
jgi:hypothetical protein